MVLPILGVLSILTALQPVRPDPAISGAAADPRPLPYTGVCLAGGEFYDSLKTPNPIYGQNYVYPSVDELNYFAGKGMNIFRIGFLWETLQRQPKQPLVREEADRLKDVVRSATEKGLTVILDPHNYARYRGKVIGGPDLTVDAFADFWRRLALEFHGDQRVWFGLMNEPHDMPTEQWLQAANAAIAAIRAVGARNMILVPGNAYTGAHSWAATWYGQPNSEWMGKVVDPANNYAYEVHQYLDADSSGTKPIVVSATIGSERLQGFTQWCRKRKKRAFLGEFAVPATDLGHRALDDMLGAMERDHDVWLGFTWWAAGPWWGDYMFSIEPKDGRDRTQMSYLRPHLQSTKAPRQSNASDPNPGEVSPVARRSESPDRARSGPDPSPTV